MQPLCFVLMPFGIKTDGNKKEINFDLVYTSFIKPAIIKANLLPIRADAEKEGGFIHKPMYERLMFCRFAIADLSFDNANVFYELGIRHAVKPYTTVLIYEKNTRLSFDVGPLRAFPYEFTNEAVTNVDEQVTALAEMIKANMQDGKTAVDSPIGQLISSYRFPDLDYLQDEADCFADWVKSSNASKEQMIAQVKQWRDAAKTSNAVLQQQSLDAVKAIETAEGDNIRSNYDILYVLLKTYRSMEANTEIIRLLEPVVKSLPRENVYLQQQLAMAYSKSGRAEDAGQLLLTLIQKYGADPETNGLLGAVYKQMFETSDGDDPLRVEYRKKAIDAYLAGFESDPRYFYPGVNALTLMFLADSPDERFTKFMPLVTYAVERLLPTKEKDYWTQATALELAVLNNDAAHAQQYLASALFAAPDPWMKKTTASNLQQLYDAAVKKAGTGINWLPAIIQRLRS